MPELPIQLGVAAAVLGAAMYIVQTMWKMVTEYQDRKEKKERSHDYPYGTGFVSEERLERLFTKQLQLIDKTNDHVVQQGMKLEAMITLNEKFDDVQRQVGLMLTDVGIVRQEIAGMRELNKERNEQYRRELEQLRALTQQCGECSNFKQK